MLPGRPYDGVARLSIVGGVDTDEINAATGVTLPVAHIAYNGATLDSRGCPFAGLVTVHGPERPGARRDDVPTARAQRHGRRLVDTRCWTPSTPRP